MRRYNRYIFTDFSYVLCFVQFDDDFIFRRRHTLTNIRSTIIVRHHSVIISTTVLHSIVDKMVRYTFIITQVISRIHSRIPDKVIDIIIKIALKNGFEVHRRAKSVRDDFSIRHLFISCPV